LGQAIVPSVGKAGLEDDRTVSVDRLPPFHGFAEVSTMVSFKASATHGVIRLLAKPFGDFRVGVVVKDSGGIENTR